MTLRRFERSIYLCTAIAIAIASSSSQAEVLHWWRFEEEETHQDIVGGVFLTEPHGQEIDLLPVETSSPGGSFPRSFEFGANRQAVLSESTAGGLYASGTNTVSEAYTMELFTNVQSYAGNGIGAILASQNTDGFNPAKFSWMLMLRTDGIFGADHGELIAWSSDGNRFEFHESDFVIEEGIDYYIAAQLDAEKGEYT
ncbi:MAG: hypothetical protein KDB27_24535, partial [Planctomycetales bacterium]|nr:hypothetical protein [Planctomycetales bacterium]